MSYDPRWELAGFDVLPDSTKCGLILTMVRALVEVNLRELPHLGLPPLYEAGVSYEFQDPQQDEWKDALEVYESGHGSCNSLVAWRVAELILAGEEAGPYIQTDRQMTRHGPLEVFHCIVWRSGDHVLGIPLRWVETPQMAAFVECPSRMLGMPALPPE